METNKWYNQVMMESMVELCRRWKRGFEAAENVIREEKLGSLAGLSPEESRKIYDGMCELYYARKMASAAVVPEDPSGSFQVLLRRRFNVLALRRP